MIDFSINFWSHVRHFENTTDSKLGFLAFHKSQNGSQKSQTQNSTANRIRALASGEKPSQAKCAPPSVLVFIDDLICVLSCENTCGNWWDTSSRWPQFLHYTLCQKYAIPLRIVQIVKDVFHVEDVTIPSRIEGQTHFLW